MGRRYAPLSVEERRKIERWRAAKISPDETARVLGRHRRTIFRELRRNHFQDRDFPEVVGYFAMAAQRQTADRRARKRRASNFAREVSILFRPETVAHYHRGSEFVARMNATPRRCLGWRTPAEVFAQRMTEIAARPPYPPNHGKSHLR